jgi:Dolichyl-phosphate-mannose-protein mannosyltransferase
VASESKTEDQARSKNEPAPVWRDIPPVDALAWTALAVGLLVRILEYAGNRYAYLDEESLLRNLLNLPVLDFHTRLTESQLAPPGFLVLERLMVRLPFNHMPTGRFVPFLLGIASMFLMWSVARRYVCRRAAPIALWLFALDDWMVYYSCELKQYSTEVALALAALLVVAPFLSAPAAAPRAMTPRRWLGLAVFGSAGVFFSFPLAFSLAAIGTYLIVSAALRRDWQSAARFTAVSVAWAVSFAICYHISHGILSQDRFIWDWWDFAFLPVPPRSRADLVRDFWHLINVFNNPTGLLTPLGILGSAFFAAGLFLVGAGSLILGRRGGHLYLLTAPIVFTLIASGLRQYPFHGRLLLFLVPGLHLIVAQGAAAITRPGRGWLTFALGAFLVLMPAGTSLQHNIVQRRAHTEYDSHGDLSHDVLDYLEELERKPHLLRASP